MTGGETSRAAFNWIRLGGFCVLSAAALCGTWAALNGVESVPFHVGMLMVIILSAIVMLASGERRQSLDRAELNRTHANEDFRYAQILTLINNLADAILSVDPDGTIRLYNAAALNLLDTNASLNDRPINEVLPLKDTDGNPVDVAALIKDAHGVKVRDDLLLHFSEDEAVRLEATFSPIRSSVHGHTGEEEDTGSIIILRDVTKSKSLEEERDEFISVVSHELRTPITIAEGTISNLELMNERGIATPEKSAAAIKGAHEQILFLASMVNDLSTLSRAERGAADEAEPIDCKALVHDLYNEYEPQAREKNLHFNLDADTKLGTVHTSPLYLRELLQNFITNAIKYTREGSITLEARIPKDAKTPRIEFLVRDSGIGMSKADLAKIFQKFYRAEDYRTRETSGTGLGLYVSAKLARKLGTKIEVTSRLNHGSTFSFSLPLVKDAKK